MTSAAASRRLDGPRVSAFARRWRRRWPPRSCWERPSLPLAALAPGRLGLVLVLGAPAAGFLAPDLWLARVAAERARRVRRELPALLDILRVSVEAGGSLPEALRSVGERSGGPLAREWAGGGAGGRAWGPAGGGARAAWRSGCRCRRSTHSSARSSAHGVTARRWPTRSRRRPAAARFALARRIRDDAARAGPKIQLVVALLLVPSVLLLVAAALASALLDGSADALPL